MLELGEPLRTGLRIDPSLIPYPVMMKLKTNLSSEGFNYVTHGGVKSAFYTELWHIHFLQN